MHVPQIEDFVVLMEDRPEYDLHLGDVGIVKAIVGEPDLVYKVEFLPSHTGQPLLIALHPEQIGPAPRSPFDPEPDSGRDLYF